VDLQEKREVRKTCDENMGLKGQFHGRVTGEK
jgi:hypothetical protein